VVLYLCDTLVAGAFIRYVNKSVARVVPLSSSSVPAKPVLLVFWAGIVVTTMELTCGLPTPTTRLMLDKDAYV
jgi:hypothetical protein